METIKAALYCRLSEEDQDKISPDQDSESIQNQRSLLTRYAKQQKWEIAGVYIDDNYAGADRNRPAFRRLLSDAEQGKFQVVLCKTQSRFTREMELVEKYLHDLFPIWGIRFIGVVDHTDTASAGNKKARQINGLVNEWYLEDLSDNIKSVLTDKRKRGQHIGSFAPYGYRKDPEEKGHLLPDEEAAAVVRDVFTWYCQGMGKTAIARLLNERGIPNPTEYKRRQGLRYQQSHSRTQTIWRYSSIDGVLRNPVYIGHMVQGKQESVSYKHRGSRPRPPSLWYIVENTHIPLIRQSLWEQAQRQLQQRREGLSPAFSSAGSVEGPCMSPKAMADDIISAPPIGFHLLTAPAFFVPDLSWRRLYWHRYSLY